MAREYITVAEFCERTDIPKRTVYDWIRKGKIEVRKDVYPALMPADQPIPVKNPDIHGWRYQF